ncbi:MAG: hypothetical protein HQM03_11545, partial [Magnetococcales bacterium]|nr:hypothetical protein [Magnetococcales bacterium]
MANSDDFMQKNAASQDHEQEEDRQNLDDMTVLQDVRKVELDAEEHRFLQEEDDAEELHGRATIQMGSRSDLVVERDLTGVGGGANWEESGDARADGSLARDTRPIQDGATEEDARQTAVDAMTPESDDRMPPTSDRQATPEPTPATATEEATPVAARDGAHDPGQENAPVLPPGGQPGDRDRQGF